MVLPSPAAFMLALVISRGNVGFGTGSAREPNDSMGAITSKVPPAGRKRINSTVVMISAAPSEPNATASGGLVIAKFWRDRSLRLITVTELRVLVPKLL